MSDDKFPHDPFMRLEDRLRDMRKDARIAELEGLVGVLSSILLQAHLFRGYSPPGPLHDPGVRQWLERAERCLKKEG